MGSVGIDRCFPKITNVTTSRKAWLQWLKRALGPALLRLFLAGGLPLLLAMTAIRTTRGGSVAVGVVLAAGLWCTVGFCALYRSLLGSDALRRLLTYAVLATVLPTGLLILAFQASRPNHLLHDWLGAGWGFLAIVLGGLVACSIPGVAFPIKGDLRRLQLRDDGSGLVLYRRPADWSSDRSSPGSPEQANAFESALSDALTRPSSASTQTSPAPGQDIADRSVRIF